jgi:hypothetical protein
MLQYLIQMTDIEGSECSFSLSPDDLRQIRAARPGRPFNLDNYIAYLTADLQLALSRRPGHKESVVVAYAAMCRKLAEAEIEDRERNSPR